MAKLNLEILVQSADMFAKSFPSFLKMHLYAVASVDHHSSPPSSTTVDFRGGPSPSWWYPAKFQLDESELLNTNANDRNLALVLRVKRRRILAADDCIGSVRIPTRDLFVDYFLDSSGLGSYRRGAFAISSKSGKTRGVLYLAYKFGGSGEEVRESAPPSLVAPSAPPLPENGENVDRSLMVSETAVAIPSAPYLPGGRIIKDMESIILCKCVVEKMGREAKKATG